MQTRPPPGKPQRADHCISYSITERIEPCEENRTPHPGGPNADSLLRSEAPKLLNTLISYFSSRLAEIAAPIRGLHWPASATKGPVGLLPPGDPVLASQAQCRPEPAPSSRVTPFHPRTPELPLKRSQSRRRARWFNTKAEEEELESELFLCPPREGALGLHI